MRKTPTAMTPVPTPMRAVRASRKKTRAPIAVSATPLAAQIPYSVPIGGLMTKITAKIPKAAA